MPTAITNPTTPTRRGALRLSTAALFAGIATTANAGAKPSPDAELIQLCAEAERCEARLRRIDKHGTSDEDCTDATHAWDDTFTKVIDTPAATIAGIQAKANALRLAIVRENCTRSVSSAPIDEILLRDGGALDPALGMSLCRDILALGGVA